MTKDRLYFAEQNTSAIEVKCNVNTLCITHSVTVAEVAWRNLC